MRYFSTQTGFSLVETLVAISLLLIVIVGPMKAIVTASNSTSFSGEQVVAFFLAQEGAEIAQKARDDLIIKYFLPTTDPDYETNPWNVFKNTSGIYTNCFDTNGCALSLSEDAVPVVNVVNCPPTTPPVVNNCLLYDNVTQGERSRYTHDSNGGANPETDYTRTIYFKVMPSGDEIEVTSTVTWRTGATKENQEVSVTTYLFNVYDL